MSKINSIGQLLRIGWIVIAALFVLTILEFAVAIALSGPIQLSLLLLIGLIKGGFIVQYFMHFGQIWKFIVESFWAVLISPEKEESLK